MRANYCGNRTRRGNFSTLRYPSSQASKTRQKITGSQLLRRGIGTIPTPPKSRLFDVSPAGRSDPRPRRFGTVNHRALLWSQGDCCRAITGTKCLALTAIRTLPRGTVAFGRLRYSSRLRSSSRWGFSSGNIGFRCIPARPCPLELRRLKCRLKSGNGMVEISGQSLISQ